jgi:hypothetical protein
MVAADARTAMTFSLSPGNDLDAAPGQALLKTLDRPAKPLYLIMDRAYEGLDTRQLALDLGFVPVVPPKSNLSNLGNTTGLRTKGAMKLNVFSDG